jgi:hypothetical protein
VPLVQVGGGGKGKHPIFELWLIFWLSNFWGIKATNLNWMQAIPMKKIISVFFRLLRILANSLCTSKATLLVTDAASDVSFDVCIGVCVCVWSVCERKRESSEVDNLWCGYFVLESYRFMRHRGVLFSCGI